MDILEAGRKVSIFLDLDKLVSLYLQHFMVYLDKFCVICQRRSSGQGSFGENLLGPAKKI